jgi:hypothetical protein
MNNFRKDMGSKSMGCTKSGLSKAFLVLISRGMADHGEQAGGFSGEQQRGQEFFFCLVVTFWPVVLSLFLKQ